MFFHLFCYLTDTHVLRTEDILNIIETQGDSIALILLPGIQFYTGQLFDIETITAEGHKKGIVVGWDLAHAVGNVPLQLHHWQVDFAAWCSYKYLNAGPGSIGGLFLHEQHHTGGRKKLHGWWGQHADTRFKMLPTHTELPGAQSYMLSNPAVLPTVCLLGSLEVHHNIGEWEKREKSVMLTQYLELLLRKRFHVNETTNPNHVSQTNQSYDFTILTPSLPYRGCQLSLHFSFPVHSLCTELLESGVNCDERRPNVIRCSPTPLYNTFTDVYRFVEILSQLMKSRDRTTGERTQ